jgi:hypothetical protein
VFSGMRGEPALRPARASICDESGDRTFLSRSVNRVEFPVEIRPKSSSAARGAEAPIQLIGLAAEAVCLQRVHSDALKGHFQKEPAYPSGWLEVVSVKCRPATSSSSWVAFADILESPV